MADPKLVVCATGRMNVTDLIGQTIGQYRIMEQIGQGGMATVYKAYQPGLERYVAFKVLPEYYAHDKTFLARFQREAKVIAKLSHPNILPIYDFGQTGNLTYIVMQYIDGGTLRSVMGQIMPLSQVVYFIDQIAEALDYAHRRGILHRDVKPGNILLEEGQRVLLTDFGLAKMMEGTVQLTGSGVGVGTPSYMSPEQGQGQGVDVRTDIYALGIILYEMTTGRVPYKADTPMAIVIKHMTAPLPLPRTINPNLPEAVERVILKTLAKNKDERYTSAPQMVTALKQALDEMLDTLGPTVPLGGHPSSTSSMPPMPPSAPVVDVQQSPTPAPGSHPAAPIRSRPTPSPAGYIPVAPIRQTPLSPVAAPRSNNILPWILGGGVLLLILLALAALVGFFIFAPSELGTPLPDQAEQPKPLETVIAEAQATHSAAIAEAQGTHSAPEQPDTSSIEQAVQIIATAQANPPLFGPVQGSLDHEAEGRMEVKFAGVEVQDFVAEAVFHTPYAAAKGEWDMGLVFRYSGGKEHFGLVVESNGDWSLGHQQGDETDIIVNGTLSNVQNQPASINRLKVMAEGDGGLFWVNDVLVAQFDLSRLTGAGDIAVGTGFYSGHEIDGEVTVFEAFTIWPITAPRSGE